MPRVVDHAARRQDLVEALWRVIRRVGIHQVSVRTVAAEAGTSPSSLRHYFTSQDELLAFALRTVVERAVARLGPQLHELTGRPGASRILEQLLPLDPTRRDEVEVYLAFLARAHTDPALRATHDDVELASRAAVRYAVQMLSDDGALGAGRSVEHETDTAYHLLDGLALHGIYSPGRYPAEHLREVLHTHLDQLAAPAP